MRKHLLSLCLFIPLAACATPIVHNTPSGKAEVTIRNTTKSEASDILADRLSNVCPNMVKADENQIVCEAPMQNNFAAMMLSSQYDAQPISRLTFNFIKVKKDVRVIFDNAGISNPGSAFERRYDMNGSANTQQVQTMLNNMKIHIEGGKR